MHTRISSRIFFLGETWVGVEWGLAVIRDPVNSVTSQNIHVNVLELYLIIGETWTFEAGRGGRGGTYPGLPPLR